VDQKFVDMTVGSRYNIIEMDVGNNVSIRGVDRDELPDNGGNDECVGTSLFVISGAEE
jgi:hypothetical protein